MLEELCLTAVISFALGMLTMRALINWLVKKAFPNLFER